MKEKTIRWHALTILNIFLITGLLLLSAVILWLSASGTNGILGWQVYLMGESGTPFEKAAVLTHREKEYLPGDIVLLQENGVIHSAKVEQAEEQVTLTIGETQEQISVPCELLLGRAVFYSVPLGKGIRFLSDHTLAAVGGLLLIFFLLLFFGILMHLRQKRKPVFPAQEQPQIVEEQLPRMTADKIERQQKTFQKKSHEQPEAIEKTVFPQERETAALLVQESLTQIPVEQEDPSQLSTVMESDKQEGTEISDKDTEETQNNFPSPEEKKIVQTDWKAIEITMSEEELEQLKNEVLSQTSEEEIL